MGTDLGPRVGEVSPPAAWKHLEEIRDSVLIDVRTKAEWSFVGVPDLSPLGRDVVYVEWQSWPDMSQNPQFVETVLEKLDGRWPSEMLFLCRSGGRSLRAAAAVSDHLSATGHDATCINVAEGFEGDLDAEKHRGGLTGWKAHGLPWRQS